MRACSIRWYYLRPPSHASRTVPAALLQAAAVRNFTGCLCIYIHQYSRIVYSRFSYCIIMHFAYPVYIHAYSYTQALRSTGRLQCNLIFKLLISFVSDPPHLLEVFLCPKEAMLLAICDHSLRSYRADASDSLQFDNIRLIDVYKI